MGALLANRSMGLTTAEAARRLAEEGPNVLPRARGPSHLRALAAQMTHLFAILLWGAATLAFVARMPQLGGAIVVVVVVNGLFAFFQELRAERAAARLQQLLPRRATVVRDGASRLIDAAELVCGDVVLLASGDRVSADLELMDVAELAVDTSLLTGESAARRPEPGDPLHAGMFVVEGEGTARVVATGAHTRLAAIATMTEGRGSLRTPLALELQRFVRKMAFVAVGVGVAFFAVGLAVGLPATDGFLFGVGVTVALVPEGMLPTITLSLAIAARRMAARHALVRRLDAVETLGATTFLCTDKTGTLTENEMRVARAWCPAGEARAYGDGYDLTRGHVDAADEALSSLRELGRAAARCSNGRAVLAGGRWIAEGDPMEAALDVFARRLAVDLAFDAEVAPRAKRFPFDPHRRRMSLVAGGFLLVKGAPDTVIPRCREPSGASEAVARFAASGLRVLAVARRPVTAAALEEGADAAETDLELLGVLGLEDPPRASAASAIAACREAGVKVAMITGDHAATAVAIARLVGLSLDTASVFEGSELPDDEASLGELLDRDGVVVSRVSPEDKLRIARALQARGHVVAMTGDGVNDAPALRQADVGVAMGRSGTDVAREAADLVLLDDDLATVVSAMEHGRATFANLRRVLTFHLTDNVAELAPFVVWAISGGRFPLALGVLQILCLDLVTDQLPALALGSEPPHDEASARRLPKRRLLDGALMLRAFGVLGATQAAVEMTAFVVALVASGASLGASLPDDALRAASGAAFLAVVVGQAGNALACRSASRPAWRIGRPTFVLRASIALGLLAYAPLAYVPSIAKALGHGPPPLAGIAVALLAAPAVLIADAAHKAVRARRARATA